MLTREEQQRRIDALNEAREAYRALPMGSWERKQKNWEFYLLSLALKGAGILHKYDGKLDQYVLLEGETCSQ